MGPADHVLSGAFDLCADGLPLPSALGLAVERHVAAQAASRTAGLNARMVWASWQEALARAWLATDRAAVLDGCFRWVMVSDVGGPRSELSELVRSGLGAGLGSVDAVVAAVDTFGMLETERRWCKLGHRLYRPAEVEPFLRPNLMFGAARRSIREHMEQVALLTAWTHQRVRWVSDRAQWGVVDLWQAPGLTLQLGSGDCEDQALVLWSAAAVVGLPTGRLVVGEYGREGHAWVEFPELGLLADATNGEVNVLSAVAGYNPKLYVYPNRCDLAG